MVEEKPVFNKNKIAKNTALLYIRMLFTMFINLYTTRLVLANLGVEDMGTYGLVGSIVGFFAIIGTGFQTAIQRFITFETGKNGGDVNLVFCTCINVLLIYAVFLLVILEIGGSWYLYNYANIPANSLRTAFWVLQCSIVVCIVTLLSIPYNAIIVANEKMGAFALVSTLQVFLNCAAAYIISFWDKDRLLIYSILLVLIGITIRLIYQIYCRIKFRESEYHLTVDKNIVLQVGKFALASSSSGSLQVVSGQGIVFIFNFFYGVAVNAVYTIALQIKNSFISFSYNLYKAISPQITKTYAHGEMESFKKLVYSGSKVEVFLNYIIMIPFFYKSEYILNLWLGETPLYAVGFTRCIIFSSLLWASVAPFYDAVYAANKVNKFLIVPEMVYLAVLPSSYVISKIYHDPVLMMTLVVLFDMLVVLIRIYYSVRGANLNFKDVFSIVAIPCVLVGVMSFVSGYLLSLALHEDSLLNLLLLIVLNACSLFVFIYFIGLNPHEKELTKNICCIIRDKLGTRNE